MSLKLLTISPCILSHPWYQRWEKGEVSRDALRTYAGQYYWQVSHFPRYLSRLHSQMEDLSQRQVILGNLLDEENKNAPHPELWLDFAEALGLDRMSVMQSQPGEAVSKLVAAFQSLVSSSPEEGLGAILAYESQVPEVARFKSEALKKYYLQDAQASQGLRFFEVHEKADIWHTQELESLITRLSPEQKERAQNAANSACSALWEFLDAMPA